MTVVRPRSASTPNTLELSLSHLVNTKDMYHTMERRQSPTPKRVQDLKRPQFMNLVNTATNGCNSSGNASRKLTKRKSTSSQTSGKSESSPTSPTTPPIVIEPPLITTEQVRDAISCCNTGQVDLDQSDSDDFDETDFGDLDDSFDRNTRHSWPSSRTVRTAPSTPGGETKTIVPQHGYSTTNLDKKRSSKGIYDDNEALTKPVKDARSKIKSRNEKFHKLFKNPPPDEICRKCYSCAYLGDILVQGSLYLSPHWFCFYSKILGREKRIEIHVSEVIKITREKVAIIIPNAIGILTPEDKYVFGSLITRDKVYQHMTTLLWRYREPNTKDIDANNELSDGNDEEDTGIVVDVDNNNESKASPITAVDCSSSEASACIQCGVPLQEHQPGECNESTPPHSSHNTNQTFSLPSTPAPKPNTAPTATIKRQVSKVNGLVKSLQGVQKNGWFMILCSAIVCLLVVSALVMSYKIVLLQARLDFCNYPYMEDTYEGMYSNIYYLNDQLHTATVQKFYSVIQANINVLDQMYQTLKSLEASTFTEANSRT